MLLKFRNKTKNHLGILWSLKWSFQMFRLAGLLPSSSSLTAVVGWGEGGVVRYLASLPRDRGREGYLVILTRHRQRYSVPSHQDWTHQPTITRSLSSLFTNLKPEYLTWVSILSTAMQRKLCIKGKLSKKEKNYILNPSNIRISLDSIRVCINNWES